LSHLGQFRYEETEDLPYFRIRPASLSSPVDGFARPVENHGTRGREEGDGTSDWGGAPRPERRGGPIL
jgi:hypothetical protein